jgi:hypothetical protein
MKKIFDFIYTTLITIIRGLLNGKRWRQLLTLVVTLWNEDLFDDPIFREIIHKLINRNQSKVSKRILRQKTLR